MEQHLSVSSSYLRAVVMCLEDQYGIEVQPILDTAGVSRAELANPHARIKGASSGKLWRLATAVTKDPCLGLRVAEHAHPNTFNALWPLMHSSSSIGEALDYLCRYFRLLSDNSATTLLKTNRGYEFFLTAIPRIGRPEDQSYDLFVALVMRYLRELAGEQLKPLYLELVHPEPHCVQDFLDYFRCDVRFGRERNVFLFSSDAIERKLPTANPDFARVSEQFVIDCLSRSSRVNYASQVFAQVLDQLPRGNMTQDTVAEKLNISVRTLQYHLQEEGASFKEISETVREDMARKYIADDRLSLNEIGYRLGFSSPSNFARSFKRWTGITPSSYRNQLQATQYCGTVAA